MLRLYVTVNLKKNKIGQPNLNMNRLSGTFLKTTRVHVNSVILPASPQSILKLYFSISLAII